MKCTGKPRILFGRSEESLEPLPSAGFTGPVGGRVTLANGLDRANRDLGRVLGDSPPNSPAMATLNLLYALSYVLERRFRPVGRLLLVLHEASSSELLRHPAG
jgi:hypothetical protein